MFVWGWMEWECLFGLEIIFIFWTRGTQYIATSGVWSNVCFVSTHTRIDIVFGVWIYNNVFRHLAPLIRTECMVFLLPQTYPHCVLRCSSTGCLSLGRYGKRNDFIQSGCVSRRHYICTCGDICQKPQWYLSPRFTRDKTPPRCTVELYFHLRTSLLVVI